MCQSILGSIHASQDGVPTRRVFPSYLGVSRIDVDGFLPSFPPLWTGKFPGFSYIARESGSERGGTFGS